MLEIERRKMLGEFLKSRRARLLPDDVGIPQTGRRRTPGLRREEVAARAGMSLTWYTWLERGRVERVSPDLLKRLADALRLTSLEKQLLVHLAEGPRHEYAVTNRLPSTLREIVDHFDPYPAYVMDARTDVLAWNRAICAVLAPLDAMPAQERNVVRILFADPTVRLRLANWEATARYMLARFRVGRMSSGPLARFDEIVSELTARSPEFNAWWKREDVATSEVTQDRVEHPEVGLLVLNYTPLQVVETGHWVMLGTPDPKTDSRLKLERLGLRIAARDT
jgi:transcriptional regulator with XRE-family HTH domain